MGKGKIIIIAVIILLIVLLFGMYNGLVRARNRVDRTWADVQNVYQRRFDLIPNLVATVKGYAEHEQETFENITRYRSEAGGKIDIRAEDLTPDRLREIQAAESQLNNALSRLMVIVENYPVLKANENFLQLQSQLEGTENRINQERRRFNQAVEDYNNAIQTMPRAIIASLFGFTARSSFEAAPGAEQAPKVDFNQ
jgi:LemA protein